MDADVLAGITKRLAKKHQVPDATAGEAVMKAYAQVRMEDAARPAAAAKAGAADLDPVQSAGSLPARPRRDAIEDRAAGMLSPLGRRPRRPTPI